MFVFNFVQLLGLVQFRHVCFVAVLHVFWTCFSLAVLVGWAGFFATLFWLRSSMQASLLDLLQT